MPKTVKSAATSTAGAQLLRLDNQLCFALYAATNAMTRLYQPLLTAVGVTYPQYLVLLVLWEQSPRTVGELGQALDLDSGTLTPLLKRMETAGLLTRRRDPADERRVVIELTAVGRQLRERALEIPAQMAGRIDLPHTELAGLRDQLKRFRNAMMLD